MKIKQNSPKKFKKNQKKTPFSANWGKLIKYCKKYIFIILLALLFAAGGTVFTILGPDKLGDMTVEIQNGLFGVMNFNNIKRIAITLIIFYSCGVVLSYLQGYIMTVVTQKITQKMRNDISRKINKLPLKYFDTTNNGDILSRVTNDVDSIGQTLNQSIGSFVSAIVLFIGSATMMFIINWMMALIAIGASLVGFILMAVIVSSSQKYFVRQQKNLGELNAHIEEVYSGHNVVKAYNAERELSAKFDKINKNLYKNTWKSNFISGLMMPLMGFMGNIGFVAVCISGALFVSKGIFGFEVIVEFMIYIRLFTQPLRTFAQSMQSFQSTGAASYRVFEFLSEKEIEDESKKTTKLEKVEGNIDFQNVHFGYTDDKIIINDFSAKIKKGQKIAIVGPTGAGKTTMVNLLMRFYETSAGDILIDGIPTKTLRRENVHRMFCMVLQDTWLFEGTIRDNIVYNNKKVTDEEVERACRAVGLHHFIQTLPEGYNTLLNEEDSLSAGQKQLLTIARAMVDNAPMLILDEATSSVDTRTEELIQKAMDRLMDGRTSIVIAHRLSTIKNADLILVMKDGDIIESGTHKNLLKKGGFYSDLYNSQFEE